MEIFNQQLAKRRKKEGCRSGEMKQEEGTKEEIQIAIWKIELSQKRFVRPYFFLFPPIFR